MVVMDFRISLKTHCFEETLEVQGLIFAAQFGADLPPEDKQLFILNSSSALFPPKEWFSFH